MTTLLIATIITALCYFLFMGFSDEYEEYEDMDFNEAYNCTTQESGSMPGEGGEEYDGVVDTGVKSTFLYVGFKLFDTAARWIGNTDFYQNNAPECIGGAGSDKASNGGPKDQTSD